jgi:hypothetical protein
MEFEARVEGLRRFTIHGEPYVVLYFSRTESPDTIEQTQLSEDALPAELAVGEPIVTLSVLGVVVGVRRLQDDAE